MSPGVYRAPMSSVVVEAGIWNYDDKPTAFTGACTILFGYRDIGIKS